MKYIRVLPAELSSPSGDNPYLDHGNAIPGQGGGVDAAQPPNEESPPLRTVPLRCHVEGAQSHAQRSKHRRISVPAKERAAIKSEFLDLAEPNAEGCWIWRGNPDDYGYFCIGRIKYPAHRVSVRLFHRTFDQSLHVLHTCDTPGCVNPGHLWTGTDADNMRDCAAKGRLPTQVNPGLVQGENNGQHKLVAEEVLEIRFAHALGASQKSLAARFRVKAPTIHKIVTRLKWRHLPTGLPAMVHFIESCAALKGGGQ